MGLPIFKSSEQPSLSQNRLSTKRIVLSTSLIGKRMREDPIFCKEIQ
jgi:hypothetical protein